MEPDGTESGGRAGVPPERALDRAPSAAGTAAPGGGVQDRIAAALERLLADVPPSGGGPAATPAGRARALTRRAATRAAVLSGSMALPTGPLGMLTILPDLVAIWNLQRQLVADIRFS